MAGETNNWAWTGAGGAGDPQRRTFINPTTEGDKRELWGQGRPMAKASVAAWATGTVSVAQNTHMNAVTSRLAFEGTVSSSDYSRITDAREKGRIGIFGTGLSFAGGSGRVTSEILGRDLNPLGRGDGRAHLGGAQCFGRIAPSLPGSAIRVGSGNSVNNFSLPEMPRFVNLADGLVLIDWRKYAGWLPRAAFEVATGSTIARMNQCTNCPDCGISLSTYDFLIDPVGSAEAYCECFWLTGCRCGDKSEAEWEWIPKTAIWCHGRRQCFVPSALDSASSPTGATSLRGQSCFGCGSEVASNGLVGSLSGGQVAGGYRRPLNANAGDCHTVQPQPWGAQYDFPVGLVATAGRLARGCAETYRDSFSKGSDNYERAQRVVDCLDLSISGTNIQLDGCCCYKTPPTDSNSYIGGTGCCNVSVTLSDGRVVMPSAKTCPEQPGHDRKILLCLKLQGHLQGKTQHQQECIMASTLLHECSHVAGLSDWSKTVNPAEANARAILACCGECNDVPPSGTLTPY